MRGHNQFDHGFFWQFVANAPPNKPLQTDTEQLGPIESGSLLAFNQVIRRPGQRCPVPLNADPLDSMNRGSL